MRVQLLIEIVANLEGFKDFDEFQNELKKFQVTFAASSSPKVSLVRLGCSANMNLGCCLCDNYLTN